MPRVYLSAEHNIRPVSVVTLVWEVEPFQSTKNEVAMEKVELVYQSCKREQ